MPFPKEGKGSPVGSRPAVHRAPASPPRPALGTRRWLGKAEQQPPPQAAWGPMFESPRVTLRSVPPRLPGRTKH